MKNKLTITIGISAYNEEANIKNLLQSIPVQNQEEYFIKEIIVISDGSEDQTAEKVREVNNKKIVFFEEKKRVGQNIRQNFILKKAKGDIIILLEADTVFKNNAYIHELIKPFITKKNISMTYGTSIPVLIKQRNFFAKMLTFVETFKARKLKTLNEENIYLCGTGKAFSKKMTESFFWPKDVPEDTYAYLFCKQNGLKTIFRPSAILHFRSPSNFSDYLKKTIRFNKGKVKLEKYFDRNTLFKSYRLPKSWLFSFLLEGLLITPTLMTAYVATSLVRKIFVSFAPEFDPLWDISESTKVLKIYEK